MAKDFKNALATGIVDSWTTVYTAAGASMLIGMTITGTINTGLTCDVRIVKAGGATWSYLGKDLPVPLGSSLQVVHGEKIVLEDLDYIQVKSVSADASGHDGGNIDVTAAIMEDLNV